MRAWHVPAVSAFRDVMESELGESSVSGDYSDLLQEGHVTVLDKIQAIDLGL